MEDHIRKVNTALHTLMFGLYIGRLGHWSPLLSDLQYLDLHVLGMAEENPHASLRDIRKYLSIPQSSLTSIVNKLERAGLVRRVPRNEDRRSYTLEITAQGQAIQDEHKRIEEMICLKILMALETDEERTIFVQLLAKVSSQL